MTATYKMRVDERGALTVPQEARDVLQLRPGDEVQVSIDSVAVAPAAPNTKMLSILQNIQESHKDRPYTDPANTDRLMREARSGAMYHDDSAE